jgi:hypothetical protein
MRRLPGLIVDGLTSCHPGANPDSCLAILDRVTCAAFFKESRMEFASATNINRKSGEAEGLR